MLLLQLLLINALVAALAAHTAALSSAASSKSSTTTAPTGNLATPTRSIPATNIFNYNALPTDVLLRYNQHADSSKMMTCSTTDVEYHLTIPNKTLDLTGATLRTTLSYLNLPVTGDRLISRNGAVFNLAAQGTDGTKEFLRNVPPCPDTSIAAIRTWYTVFSVHAANHDIFVQPYFCFRLDANATKGFTIGNDTDLVKFDLPGKYIDREQYWAMTIWAALSKTHVFSADSAMKKAVVGNWSNSYDAIRAIIVPLHPLVIEQPLTLICETPRQLPHDSVSDLLLQVY